MRTANFTKLQFHGLHARPESVRRFLEWPKTLYEFTLNDMTYDGYSWAYTEPDPSYRWNHSLIVKALAPQKDHLRVLDLGWLGYDYDQNTFQVSAFPNLQIMALTVAYERPDQEACQNWLTPSLSTLILDLHKNDSQGGPSCYHCMSKRGAESIVSFVRLAREWSDKSGHVVGLRRIGIRAYSRGDSAWRGEDEVDCLHGEYGEEMKKNLLQCLKDIEAQGFEAFWVGYSGCQYTVEMMEAMCRCKKVEHK
ncbi:f-box domain-containing protein [Fusarium heterosporum]|uniref:F-box domain-containing protein n=1 Tax=Fusarium heterosporum TaxID=42747 RepID=A0A8H5T014_FUSHE|nr:f-box domain-containing protein [Fusarium heterosporum]